MLARVPLIPVVLLISFITLIATVLAVVGAPMAGAPGAFAAAIGAGVLTIPMALAFSHGAPADSKH